MAPRASWKGYLKLRLVSCPVRIYPATSASERIAFNMLHKDTNNRINMKPVDPERGRSNGRTSSRARKTRTKYVIMDERIRKGDGYSTQTMNIEAFVDKGRSIDLQGSPYYLAPDGAMAEETFVVLRAAMDKTSKRRSPAGAIQPRAPRLGQPSRKGMSSTCCGIGNEVRGSSEYFGNIPVGKPVRDAPAR